MRRNSTLIAGRDSRLLLKRRSGERLLLRPQPRFAWGSCAHRLRECRDDRPATMVGLLRNRHRQDRDLLHRSELIGGEQGARAKVMISSVFEFTTFAPVAGCTGPVGSRGLNGPNLVLSARPCDSRDRTRYVPALSGGDLDHQPAIARIGSRAASVSFSGRNGISSASAGMIPPGASRPGGAVEGGDLISLRVHHLRTGRRLHPVNGRVQPGWFEPRAR